MIKSIFLTFFLVAETIQSLSFTYVLKEKPMCFFENLPQNVIISFHIIANTTEFTFKVDKKVKKLYNTLYNSSNTILIRWTHTTQDKKQELRYCFTPNQQYVTKIEIQYKYGSETNDYSAIANQNHLSKMEVELRKLNDLQEDIRRQKNFIIEREYSREEQELSVSKHIISYGLMSLGIFFILSYFTMRQIRNIILSKKVN